MKKSILKDNLKTLFLTKDMLRSLSDENEESINKSITRWIKSGDLVKLKNGLYISKENVDSYSSTEGFTELIANKLRTPSYVSLEYVLAKYGILTEAIYAVTSLTLKTGRKYSNPTGEYIYRNIRKELFTGYTAMRFLNYTYYIATKEKALFDYIYFSIDTLPEDLENINLVEELRLNMKSFKKKELVELQRYAKISKNKKVVKIIENIVKNASN